MFVIKSILKTMPTTSIIVASTHSDDVVDVPSILNTTGTAHSNNTRSVRILCYGDSLTSGLSPPNVDHFCPYSHALQESLEDEHLPAFGLNYQYRVDHVGLSGWTTTQLLKHVKSKKGLWAALKAANSSSTTTNVVLLLAGTNDVPRLLRSAKGNVTKAARYLTRNLWTLHEIALAEGADHTIAIAIPSSKYQVQVASAARLVEATNQNMEERVSSHDKTTFQAFPFSYNGHNNDINKSDATSVGNWAVDGLHLSCQGYENLGKALAPVVASILDEQMGANDH